MTTGVYDTVALFGIDAVSAEPLPEALAGELIVRYCGWSMEDVRKMDVGKEFMYRQDLYQPYKWSTKKLPSGIYRLRVPVLESNYKVLSGQLRFLAPDEEIVPLVLLVTALLAHRLHTREDPLLDGWSRSQDQQRDGTHVGVRWENGQLRFYNFSDDFRSEGLWLSACRRKS